MESQQVGARRVGVGEQASYRGYSGHIPHAHDDVAAIGNAMESDHLTERNSL